MHPHPHNFTRRFSRATVLALLVYEAFFLNILVPVHTRGAITMDRNGRRTVVSPCCAEHETAQQNSSKHTPTQRDRDNCVICNFAARLSIPPVLVMIVPELGLTQLRPIPPPHIISITTLHFCHRTRGPPDCA